MTTTIYTSKELSNERYHSEEFPQASGSVLAAIHADCPAAWRYGEKKETACMADGIAAHVALLEPEEFEKRYVRGLDPADHPGVLITGKDLEGWCRAAGIKGFSDKKKAELIEFVLDKKQPTEIVKIWDLMVSDFEVKATENNQQVIKPEIYDTVKKMRDVIFLNGYGELLANGHTEISIINEDLDLKVRLDFAGEYFGPVITDYKTTSSAHPEIFGAQAHRMNYWLKMALQHDLFLSYYGVEPKVILLAQSTKPPYLAQAYRMTKEQLEVGREQYRLAHKLYSQCSKENVWPAYGGDIIDLQTPGWVSRQYQFED